MFLNAALLVWLARISYSLYMWQEVFLTGKGEPWDWFPANVGLVFLFAALSYYFVEQPAIRLGHAVVERRAQLRVLVEDCVVAGPGD